MNSLAMAIVLTAALLHAGWNYLTKKSERKIVFIWWFLLIAMVLYLPMFLYCWPQTPIPPAGWYCVAATSVLHGLYFWFLGGAYERGDLSLVYPLARGSGPLFVPFLAVALIHEHLTILGIVGIALVVLGIYVIHLQSFSRRALVAPFTALRGGGASLWALCTGGTIAGYSLNDKVGVGFVFPPVYIYLAVVGAWLFLTPPVLARERGRLKAEWRLNRLPILAVAFLSTFTYMMVLFALRMSRVSYVAAVREVSIVFSSLFGIAWLREQYGRQKLLGSVLIALGVVFIGLSR
jgi:drug/metabolite transporter (DMT)-like permease